MNCFLNLGVQGTLFKAFVQFHLMSLVMESTKNPREGQCDFWTHRSVPTAVVQPCTFVASIICWIPCAEKIRMYT